MSTGYIDFISAYCDRWCERCAFTTRCSAFAVKAASAMCGDFEQGVELAVGRPHPVDGVPAPPQFPFEDFAEVEMSPADHAEFDRREAERQVRIDTTDIMAVATAVTMVAYRWLDTHYQRLAGAADVVLREALEIALYDAAFVTAKLHRALHGRDHRSDEDSDEHPIQNDWNGSAKIALISLDRSETAWRTIAQSLGDGTAAELADQLRDLRAEVEQAFPQAWSFIRPGFDEPGR